MTAAERARHRAMMLAPWRWPRRPILPLKRSRAPGEFPELALLVERPLGAADVVWFATCAAFPLWSGDPPLTARGVDAVLDDGWEVD